MVNWGKKRRITVESMLSSYDFRRGCDEVFREIRFNPDRKHTKSPFYYEWGRIFGVWLRARGLTKPPKWQDRQRRVSERAKLLIRKAWEDGVIR